MRYSRRNAFTLLELLVVIIIISILIAIMVPSLGTARARAQKTACQATLKGLGVGFETYLSENNRLMPDAALVPSIDGAGYPTTGHAPLPVALASQVSTPAAWRCAGDRLGHKRESDAPGFLVVGAYPPGQDWDLRRGDPAEHDEVVANIARVPDPASDPVVPSHRSLLTKVGNEMKENSTFQLRSKQAG